MNHEQFEREKNYRVSISIAKIMLSKDLITAREYRKINFLLVEKYRPVIGGL